MKWAWKVEWMDSITSRLLLLESSGSDASYVYPKNKDQKVKKWLWLGLFPYGKLMFSRVLVSSLGIVWGRSTKYHPPVIVKSCHFFQFQLHLFIL